MDKYEQRRFKIQEKLRSMPDALKRDMNVNYYEGYFSITINVRDRAPLLGFISVVNADNLSNTDSVTVEKTELGDAVLRCWESIPRFHPNITLIDAQVMPEHFHGLLYMKQDGRKHLGKVINGFMSGCTQCYWDSLGIPWREMKEPPKPENGIPLNDHSHTSPGDAPSAKNHWTDRDHKRSFRGPSLFVRGYNDMEAFTEKELQTKIEYIRSNPQRRAIKGMLHDIFRVERNKTAKGWTLDIVKTGLRYDSFLRHDEERLNKALGEIMPKLHLETNDETNTVSHLLLDYVGNKSLLLNPRKVSLICHRNDLPFFGRQKEATLNAAHSGATVVSAFISPKERDIMSELIAEGLPFIQVMDNGFSKVYKPSGKAFYSCAENKLLQITCWKYEYHRTSTISRPMCMTMNQLVRAISKVEDGWWKL